jgi:hypothetical protein
MKSTNYVDRIKVKDILDSFCTPERKMMYDFIHDWDKIDAVLLHEGSLKPCGVARVFTSACNYGSKPVVELDKEAIDFMYEMGGLMGKAAAVIVKFRNQNMYWRIDRKLTESTKKGKPVYHLPINLLKSI